MYNFEHVRIYRCPGKVQLQSDR